ncbi:hypothetical protein [Bradyrhizobium sp.]|uniref:hypothetical protein n=1 Tax=Bradyrhizobium sp. TaxID=376 RepID=UPI003C371D59
MAISDQIDNAESGGNPNATNSNSSAAGPGQFIDSTWLSVLKQHRPDIAAGKSDADLLALKTDPVLAPQMTDAYAADNQAVLANNGLPVTPGTTYLAHFAGPGAAVKILQADPGDSAADILGPAATKANPFLRGMTAQGLQAWAAKKMGTAAPQPGPQNNAPQAAPAAPGPIAPPGPPPIFASAGPQNAGLQAPAAGAEAAPMPAPSPQPFAAPNVPPPIFVPQPRQIDLSKLRAALAARAPIFSNLQG